MKIYIASSWKNTHYSRIRTLLCKDTIMDWQATDGGGFRWQECSDTPPEEFNGVYYRDFILNHPRAVRGFQFDYGLMRQADLCILLLPCGRSAHLEAGVFIGSGKPLIIHIPEFDTPELMYKFADHITLNDDELINAIYEIERALPHNNAPKHRRLDVV